ncbi:MAG: BatA domain-containing protein [Gemmatimonadota bacterium]|nr:MAG: BatA domain-containing protein [Gemmatimonadota bacterium]
MGFLAPVFFVGLAALSVPVIVHLTERQREEVVHFPSLMFLHRIPFRSTERRKIRNWFLLAIRCLALLVLLAAFSRPFLATSEISSGAVLGPREIVVLVDRSYSMGYGTRWERATGAAREVLDEMRSTDRVSLIFFSTGAHAVLRASSDKPRLLAALDSTSLSAEATRFGPALKLAQSILDESEYSDLEAVIISDFQRSAWSGDESVAFPPGTTVTPIEIGEKDQPNMSVAGVTLRKEFFSGRERIRVAARLTREAGGSLEDVTVRLELDGHENQARTVRLDPTGSAAVTFDAFTLSDPFTRGTVRIDADAMPQDNSINFVLSPGRALSILILEGQGARKDASLYLRRALEISEAATFQVVVRPSTTVTAADLDTHSLVILNGARLPGGTSGQRLREFVQAGGGLLMVLGERSAWRDGLEAVFSARFGPATDHARRGPGRIGFVDYSHPVFEVFSGPRGGDFSRARFFRSRPLTVSEGDRVLARFDDGSAALVERQLGEGRIMVWASTLDGFWNDLALQPVFLPFVHRLAQYLGGFGERVPWFTAGQVIDLSDLDLVAGAASTPEELIRPDEERVALAPGGGSVLLPPGAGPRYLELREQGFYEVRPPGSNEPRPLTFAVNVDPSESDLSTMDPDELAAAVAPREQTVRAGPAAGTLGEVTNEDRERRQSLWRFLLVAAFILLVTETALSNWLSRVAGSSRFEDGRGHAKSIG